MTASQAPYGRCRRKGHPYDTPPGGGWRTCKVCARDRYERRFAKRFGTPPPPADQSRYSPTARRRHHMQALPGETFTAAQLAEAGGIARSSAYWLIYRWRERGLITFAGLAPKASVRGQRRNLYRLTPAGHAERRRLCGDRK